MNFLKMKNYIILLERKHMVNVIQKLHKSISEYFFHIMIICHMMKILIIILMIN